MSQPRALTLGDLYGEMRAGLGDAGLARLTIEFREREPAATRAVPAAEPPHAVDLRAVLDHRDGELVRAALTLEEPVRSRRILVRRGPDGHAYSLDGGAHWGRLSAPPGIVDLGSLEAELRGVAVADVTFEEVAGEAEPPPPGAPPSASALDVSLDPAAFAGLLRVFSADPEEGPDAPAVTAFSVSLEAGEEVSLLYWWTLTGVDPPLAAATDGPGVRLHCSVSIHVAQLAHLPPDEVRLDPALPDVANLDSVWALLREGSAPV
jgi:hypothetical protein